VGAEDRSARFRSTALGQGANMALPIWGLFMQRVYRDNKLDISKEDFERPESMIGMNFNCEELKQQEYRPTPYGRGGRL
jgi:penicillin-binding protein 1A